MWNSGKNAQAVIDHRDIGCHGEAMAKVRAVKENASPWAVGLNVHAVIN
jgi:hypothetical protein